MLKVLIVDDNKQTTQGLLEQIDWERTNCVCAGIAHNGKKALELVKETNPNIIITDVKMPIMDGITLAKNVFTDFPGINIIMLSAYDNFEYAKMAIEYNVKDYILKPLTRDKITAIEKRLLTFQNITHGKLKSWNTVLNDETTSTLSKLILNEDREKLIDYARGISPLGNENENGIHNFESTQQFVKDLLVWIFNFQKEFSYLSSETAKNFEENMRKAVIATSSVDLIDICTNAIDEVHQNVNKATRHTLYDLVNDVKRYILNNIKDTELSIYKICQNFNVSTSYMSAVFKKNTSTSINNFIILARNDLAKQLLSTTQLTVNEVSAKCGYFDSHYFSRVFKKLQNLTPKEYHLLHFKGEI